MFDWLRGHWFFFIFPQFQISHECKPNLTGCMGTGSSLSLINFKYLTNINPI